MLTPHTSLSMEKKLSNASPLFNRKNQYGSSVEESSKTVRELLSVREL